MHVKSVLAQSPPVGLVWKFEKGSASFLVLMNYGVKQKRFCSVSSQFSGRKTWRWPGASHLSSLSTSLTRRLAAQRLFRVVPCREGTIHLQISMPSPGFEPRPYGSSLSITNYYTGWAACVIVLT
ncbi:hypothetical protein TNCV_3020101 [Trichonephila clavipes]|nr:hypothetical protein TNCV_3020101 [Trichonephila clavipes]